MARAGGAPYDLRVVKLPGRWTRATLTRSLWVTAFSAAVVLVLTLIWNIGVGLDVLPFWAGVLVTVLISDSRPPQRNPYPVPSKGRN
jgi:hypothetical protein